MCRAYRLTKVSQNKWSYEYDAIGSVMKITDPLSKVTVTPKHLIGGYTFEKAVRKLSDFSSASVAKTKKAV
jgi:YD repeat-containing protein